MGNFHSTQAITQATSQFTTQATANGCYGANSANGANGKCITCNDVVNAYKKKNWVYDIRNFEQCNYISPSTSSCYGASTGTCSTCNDVVNAYTKNNWFADTNNFAQCNATPPLKTVDYIKYDSLLLNDGSGKKDLTNDPSTCIKSCLNNPNCRGVNIVNNVGQNEVSTDGYNYQNVPKVTCEYVDNVCYSNAKENNSNSTFYAKKHNLHFENNVPYLLKNNGRCLSVTNSQSGPVLNASDCNDSSKVTPVFFDTVVDTIKVGTDGDVCLKYGNDQIQLQKCNTFDESQKFIYDHVYNTLRPNSDTTKCLVTSKGEDGYKFGIGQCDWQPPPESNTTFENYYKPDPTEDYIEYFENDYSVDMRYYIIYMILLCMIAYLVIVSSSKKSIINNF